ncbi:MAG: cupin domain-containing protein [Chitinivibrionales bacterium]|nr:cupin domain-containing protein [Chitinivibrionales bacterium]
MLLKNMLTERPLNERCHDGAGRVINRRLFRQEDFTTKLASFIRTEIPPGSSVGCHHHPHDEEVFVILEGEGILTVNEKEFVVGAGDVIVNQPGDSHGLKNDATKKIVILVFKCLQ